MHGTIPLGKMASTHAGMRRILKRRPSVLSYIRSSVLAGTWNGADQPGGGGRGGRNNQQRGNRGRNEQEAVEPYPKAYEILSLNPPIAPPARLPLKLRKQRRKVHLPTDRLIRSYLKRHDDRMRAAHPPSVAQVEEDRYAKLLGLSAASASDAMGRKSPVLANAYTFALKQYDVLRADEAQGGAMTEEESVEEVERLLAHEAEEERRRSRERADGAQQWREAREGVEKKDDGAAMSESGGEKGSPSAKAGGALERDDDADDVDTDADAAPSVIPTILHGKPRALAALTIWSRRLAAVPYSQWTVGAAAALDHWIAIDVLGLTEETWDKLLAGDDGEDDEVMVGRGFDDEKGVGMGLGVGVGMKARARDVVAVRTALFPETVLFGGYDGEGVDVPGVSSVDEEEDYEDNEGVDADAKKSIDELLASLTSFDDGGEDEEEWTKLDGKDKEATTRGGDLDERVADVVDALQEWRAKHVEAPYESWNEDDRAEFDEWLTEYISLVTTETDGPVDLSATRTALLSSQPTSRSESDSFWSSIRDETQAEIFLSTLHAKDRPKPKDDESIADKAGRIDPFSFKTAAREATEIFLNLPYERQLRKLVDLGTLRPLFDEYTPESERVAFLRRHAESLLEGTEVEHLVPDPNGPISADDLDSSLMDGSDLRGAKGAKFRIEMIKYGSDEFGTIRSERARMLYRAWNEHKAGRARYEEAMFRKGKLGLRQEPRAGRVKR